MRSLSIRLTWGSSREKCPRSVRRARPAAATHTRLSTQPSRCSRRSVTSLATFATWSMSSIWPSSIALRPCSSFSIASTCRRSPDTRPTTPMMLRVPISRAKTRSASWTFTSSGISFTSQHPYRRISFVSRTTVREKQVYGIPVTRNAIYTRMYLNTCCRRRDCAPCRRPASGVRLASRPSRRCCCRRW